MAQFPPASSRRVSPPPPPSWWLFPPYMPLPPPPPPLPIDNPSSSHGQTIVYIIVSVLSSLVVFTTVWALCREHRHRLARAAATAADTGAGPSPEHGSGRPLRQAYTANPTADLPAFMYSRSVKHNLAGGGGEAATCSVCLGEFLLGETVRLLPVCLHLYHAECIDPWLDEHWTCPLCRSDTDPTTGIRLPHV